MKIWKKSDFVERVRAICEEVGPSITEIAYESPGMSFKIKMEPGEPKQKEPARAEPIARQEIQIPQKMAIPDPPSSFSIKFPGTDLMARFTGGLIELIEGKVSHKGTIRTIRAPRAGIFYVGKTHEEKVFKGGKKKDVRRTLQPNDLVTTGHIIGMVADENVFFAKRREEHRELVQAPEMGRVFFFRSLDGVKVIQDEPVMLLFIEGKPERASGGSP